MRNFSNVQRIVIKLGTNILAPNGLPNEERIQCIARDVAQLRERGTNPILVSSGAIGFGVQALNMEGRPKKVALRQAAAAVGQPLLMDCWRRALQNHGISAAQILLSRESFDDRKAFLNLRNAVESLLALGTVPILNENDSVSTAEIGDVFGDNDSLSAHVASKLDAGLLILLTDIDAMYDSDPRSNPQARPLRVVEEITESIRSAAGSAGSSLGTGGMVTKVAAVEVAARAGCRTILADGRIQGVLTRLYDGEELGTLFLAGKRMGARNRWILGARPRGTISVDDGALSALARRKSLLPKGIIAVEGQFDVGDVVSIGTQYRALVSMGSEEIRRVQGKHTREIESILGKGRREEVIRAEDIVPLPPSSC
ncbi:MAG: glutamate 5-kinase [Spirochaetales bacterium]|nr:glutamate 5-kinase [Spirochaetales bacterium]